MSKKVKHFFKNYPYNWKFKLAVCLPVFLSLVGLDWISKGIVQATMAQGSTTSFIPGFLEFNFIINPGSAYGFNANNLILAVSLATIMTVILMVAFVFINGKSFLVGLTIIIAGSFANLLARAWAPAVSHDPLNIGVLGQRGGVVDFLHFQFTWLNSDSYIFNLADLWVIIGVVFVVLGAVYEVISLGLKKKNSQTEEEVETIGEMMNSKVKPIAKQSVKKFVFRDEEKMTKTELKQYRKELKAYWKMKEMEEKNNAKKNR